MNPPSIALELRGIVGTSIHEVAREAIGVANTLQVAVDIDFNGIELLIVPGENYERVVKQYYKGLKPKLPIEPGWYWFKAFADSKWRVEELFRDCEGYLFIGSSRFDRLAESAEFGPKIPPPITDEYTR